MYLIYFIFFYFFLFFILYIYTCLDSQADCFVALIGQFAMWMISTPEILFPEVIPSYADGFNFGAELKGGIQFDEGNVMLISAEIKH